MKEQFINEVLRTMQTSLNNAQMLQLQTVLQQELARVEIIPLAEQAKPDEVTNEQLLSMFLDAKRVEGCSDKTVRYYENTLKKLFSGINMLMVQVKTEDLRSYLSEYRQRTSCSKANIDNLRRIFSSFFSWLEDENYILKSPVRRIHKVKSEKQVKETYSDETLESLRDGCTCLRDLAMIDLLTSTGIRVSELVKLNRDDINFEGRECIVFGKGSKERPVYFDARTKVHLKNYLDSRTDDNPALFVTLQNPHKRLEISGVEIRVRELGRKLDVGRVHPHKFRRTLATKAIDKGMPVEQVQRLLGHSKIETTMEYAMVDQNNVKQSHRKFLS
ncbi:MAG: tyrosine-type recombinase/integrase [Clostridia bacterium]|nr:tyrosine-type recombinase/integrase [Clostridia bacterium]